MPTEETYQRRITPEPATPMPLANAATYGAEVGQAVEQAGQQWHQDQIRDYTIERRLTADRETTDSANQQAQARVAADQVVEDARNDKSDPNYTNHVANVVKAYDDISAPILDGITDDAVRNETRRQIDAHRANLALTEQNFVQGQRAAKMLGDADQTTSLGSSRVVSQQTPDDLLKVYGEEMIANDAMANGLKVPAEVAQKTLDHGKEKLGTAMLDRMTDLDPNKTIALIDSGKIDGLSGQQLQQARAAAQTEQRRRDAQARQMEAAGKADYVDRKTTAQQWVDTGRTVPDATLVQLHADAIRYNDGSGKDAIETMAKNNQYTRQYESQPPIQQQLALTHLRAIRNPSPDQQQEIHWLETTGKSMAASFDSDQVAWAQTHAPPGSVPPPITDGFDARRNWLKSKGPAFGMSPDKMLSEAEAADLRAAAQHNDQGKLDVANRVATLGGRDAISMAKQIAPDDAMLRQLVVIAPTDRPLVLNGGQFRHNNANLIDGQNTVMAQTRFANEVGTALQLFTPQQQESAFESGRSIYAQWAATNGAPAYADRAYRPYIERGLGAKIGTFHTAKVLLPPGMTEDQFGRALQNYKPTTGKDAPWNATEKRPMTADELRAFVPVARPDGLYEFHAKSYANVAVTKKNGNTFTAGIK